MKPIRYHFDLILHLARRNFILQYQGSALGVLWSLLLPLFQLTVLVFLFQKIIPLNVADFPAFVFAALIPWNWFSNSINSAPGVFLSNRDLVRRPNFVSSLLLIVNVVTQLFTFLVSLPILFAILLWSGRGVAFSWVFFPILVLTQGILLVGLGLILAVWNVFYRDVGHLVTMAVMLLFYVTPVFYLPQWVDRHYRFFFAWNPVAILVQNYRAIFYYGAPPDWGSLLTASFISAGVLGAGIFVYHRQIHNVIDAI